MALAQAAPELKSKPNLPCMSDETWQEQKKVNDTKKKVQQAKRMERKTLLSLFVSLWRIVVAKPVDPNDIRQRLQLGNVALIDEQCRRAVSKWNVEEALFMGQTMLSRWKQESLLANYRAHVGG